MKTHAEIVSMLRARERTLKTEFGIIDMGLVFTTVDYKPVASVRIFVGGLAPDGFDRLKAYLAAELEMPVEVIETAKANGNFRYVFTRRRQRSGQWGMDA